jgi:hypothetical protein
VVDIFTKPLPFKSFEKLKDMLGMNEVRCEGECQHT